MHQTNSASGGKKTPVSPLPFPGWWLSGSDGLIYPNLAFQEYTGADAPLTASQLLSCIHPADAAEAAQLFQQRPEKQQTVNYRLKNHKGQYRWHSQSWSVSLASEGAPGTNYLAVYQDIHDLYSREAYFKSRFEEIFNESFQFTGLLDTEGRMLEANKSALNFCGFEWKDVKGRFFWEAGWWKSTEANNRRLRKAVMQAARGNFVRSEEIITDRNGEELFIDFSLKPLFNENEEVMFLIAEGRDISELHHTRNQLKASESKWRTLVENTPDIIVRHSPSLHYLFINQAIESHTGLSPGHFIGKKPEEVALPQAQNQRYVQALHKALAEKEQVEYAADVQTSNGIKALFTTITPELNEEDEVKSLLVVTRDISELKEKEKQLAAINQELKLSNVKLRNILDSTKDAICSRDRDFRLLAFNKSFAKEYQRIYGIQPEPGQDLKATLSHLPNELESLQQLWHRAFKGEAFTILQELGDPGINRNYYEITFNPIFDEQGQQIGATIASRDVSRERRIEKELKDAREFLILAENIPQIIFTTDPNGVPDYLNQAFYEYTGLSGLEMGGQFASLFIQPADLGPFRALWADAVKNTEGLQQEIRIRHHSGEYRWNIVRFIPLINAEEQVFKWIGSATDIHEAKISEERQRMAAQEFRQLANSLPQIIWTATAEGKPDYLNHKWYEYTGLPQNQEDDFDWHHRIHPDDLEQAVQGWKHSVETQEEYRTEYRIRNKEGEYRWFLAKGIPLYNAEGEIMKWFGSCTDIHDQKLQNKRLWQQNLQLNQINQYLDNFVHTAAHDLRAPIANMKGLLSLLDLSIPEKAERIVENLNISAERMDTTLQGMIQLIEAQNQQGDIMRDIDIEEEFLSTLKDFKPELSAVDHAIHTSFEGCRHITFVRPYLHSIFRNLLSNSIKYRKAEEPLHIRMECTKEEGFVVVTYQDNGIGIDLERYGKNLFRPFRRFTSQASGKGIGMHIVKNMLVKTGGKIKVESKPGQGTTFLLYLKNLPEAPEIEEEVAGEDF
ncbi:PAS domain S-box protein [Nafulsella turpanensis]|uniref:PAS domain S-box protein n=1 Tax=Nafulsella turpanensis TaxID=1265690 RepID=UPI0003479440|nr:PAS domain S-box protein [Nafulsella turpanensis]